MTRRPADGGLRKEFHKHLPQVHWQAIEVGMMGAGVPDHNGCFAREWWSEYKWTETHTCPLRPPQVGWLLDRTRARGRCFVITRREHEGGVRKGAAQDELWIHDARHAAVLQQEGLLAVPPLLPPMSGGPSLWDWGLVLQVLVGYEFA